MHLYDFLSSATEMLREYVLSVQSDMPSARHVDVADEAVDRLEQADWLLRQATKVEDEALGAFRRSGTTDAWPRGYQFLVRLHTECFYLVAARGVEILENRWIPYLSDFKCEDIKKVRNLLITHSERDNSGVTGYSWSHFDPDGPRMKSLRPEDQLDVFHDPGLFVNATALKEAVISAVGRARERKKLTG